MVQPANGPAEPRSWIIGLKPLYDGFAEAVAYEAADSPDSSPFQLIKAPAWPVA
ncbi:hypothetical protein ACFSNO_10035 [Streptomyces cirratus]